MDTAAAETYGVPQAKPHVSCRVLHADYCWVLTIAACCCACCMLTIAACCCACCMLTIAACCCACRMLQAKPHADYCRMLQAKPHDLALAW
jgi:hypothetical protein